MTRFLIVLALLVMIGSEWLLSSFSVSEALVEKLDERQTKQLDIFLEVNKLLTTLAAGAIAATAGFFTGKRAQNARRLAFVWGSFGISLYAGFVASQQLVWMLDKRFFNLYHPLIVVPVRVQFWAFLLGILFLARVVHQSLQEEKPRA
jgi:hypothetical protein